MSEKEALSAWQVLPLKWVRVLALLIGAALSVYIVTGTASVAVPLLTKLLGILSPVLVAFSLAYLLDPLVDWFEDRGRSRNFGIAIVILSAGLALILTFAFIMPPMVRQLSELGPKVATYSEKAAELIKESTLLQRLGGEQHEKRVDQALALAQDGMGRIPWKDVAGKAGDLVGSLLARGYGVGLALGNLMLLAIMTVYLLKDIDVIKARLMALVPPGRRSWVLAPMLEVDKALSGFVRGQLIVAACLGLLYMVGLSACGTPLALAIGLFAGAVSFIPYLGLIVGMVPALILNFLEHGSPTHLLGVLATFGIAQFLEGVVITPRIMAGSVGLHPVVVIVAIVGGGSFFGLAGMLLAIPAVAAAMVFLRRAHAKYEESEFFNASEETG